MQELLAFLFLGVGRLREDHFIYIETRENVFFIIWDLQHIIYIIVLFVFLVPGKLAVNSIAKYGIQWVKTVRSKSGSGESELFISCLVLLKGV